MKELTIQQKAEAYDKVFARAKRMFSEKELNYLFSELAESEDERIKKELIQYFSNFNLDTFAGLDPKKILAWLEKQGEQREQLINKACDLLVNCIEDFMLRRMEIWDEECKKQTLENIRKKLEE